MTRRLLVLPDDTAQPILDAVGAARRTLLLRLKSLAASVLLEAVIKAASRGVGVRMLVSAAPASEDAAAAELQSALAEAGVECKFGNPKFASSRQQALVTDDSTAIIVSLSWHQGGLDLTRDYAVVTTHRHEVREMTACFDADWTDKGFSPRASSRLIWCPNNGRERVAEFIDRARTSIWMQNAPYQDMLIVERLVTAARRGVKLHLMMRPPVGSIPDKLIEHTAGARILQDLGATIRAVSQHRLRAKIMMADRARAIVGSIGLATGNLDTRRELAVEVSEAGVIRRLEAILRGDWAVASKIDLSDESLLGKQDDLTDVSD